ncbi:MAG: beta-lactamase family protein [Mariniphaga sp.]|nr:beta-lactamase family protein [Mariniphaga sp.]
MKISFTSLMLICWIQIFSTAVCTSNSIKADTGSQRLKNVLAKTVSEEKLPGMIAAIANKNGLLLIESAGRRNVNSFMQITKNDLFHIGSCTKAMTGTLMAILISDNKLSWESTIIEIFPEVKNSIHKKYHNITLHQLLTHRGEIPANAKDWGIYTNQELKERRLSIMKDNLKEANQLMAGENLYSNLGYMIAGCMAERVTGLTWEELMKKYLFEPLGMKSAGFGAPGSNMMFDQPWGHNKLHGEWVPRQIDNPEALGPAGTVHCTLKDWAKFVALQLPKNKNSLLNQNQLDFLIEPIGSYACGWGVHERNWANGIALTHSGSNTLWYATVWVAPKLNRIFLVGTNFANENSGIVCDKIIGELIQINQEFYH